MGIGFPPLAALKGLGNLKCSSMLKRVSRTCFLCSFNLPFPNRAQQCKTRPRHSGLQQPPSPVTCGSYSLSCGADTRQPDLLKKSFQMENGNQCNKQMGKKKYAEFNVVIYPKVSCFNPWSSPSLHL